MLPLLSAASACGTFSDPPKYPLSDVINDLQRLTQQNPWLVDSWRAVSKAGGHHARTGPQGGDGGSGVVVVAG